MRTWSYALVAVAVLCLSGCGYNSLQQKDEGVKAAWSEVVNQYQRRADLIPNLVNTVKGYAAQEQRVLVEVTEARAKVGSIQVTPEVLNNPELFQKYQAAQNQLTGALKSLFAVSENYPELKANNNFMQLQKRISELEEKIADRREFFNDDVNTYNIRIQQLPDVFLAGLMHLQHRDLFKVTDEDRQDVEVKIA